MNLSIPYITNAAPSTVEEWHSVKYRSVVRMSYKRINLFRVLNGSNITCTTWLLSRAFVLKPLPYKHQIMFHTHKSLPWPVYKCVYKAHNNTQNSKIHTVVLHHFRGREARHTGYVPTLSLSLSLDLYVWCIISVCTTALKLQLLRPAAIFRYALTSLWRTWSSNYGVV